RLNGDGGLGAAIGADLCRPAGVGGYAGVRGGRIITKYFGGQADRETVDGARYGGKAGVVRSGEREAVSAVSVILNGCAQRAQGGGNDNVVAADWQWIALAVVGCDRDDGCGKAIGRQQFRAGING